jgi:hypothetical protein
MKTDRTALLWGTIVGVGIVAVILVQAFEFPNFRLPFSTKYGAAFVSSAMLFGLLIASYRKLWKTPGFWALLLVFLGAHTALYWLFLAKMVEENSGLRMDARYGAIGGVEFAIFALIVLRLFHRSPDTRSFTGPKDN